MVSILSTIVAALVIFVATVAISGGIAINLVKGYVVPLFISAFTLTVFWGVLFARSKGKLPFLGKDEPPRENQQRTNPQ